MLYTKFQPQNFLGSEEEDFLSVLYHIWACQPSCSMVQNHLFKLMIPLRQEAPVKPGENLSSISEKKT